MRDRLHVAVIYGSARQGRMCERVGAWVLARLDEQPEFTFDVIDPRDGLSGLKGRLERADAYIVVVPEYNHGYPAALKELLDAAYDEWQGKAAAFVSYGGKSGGIRAVEQLRQVFAELHVATVREGVAFADVWERFDGDGRLHDATSAGLAFRTMARRLHWWARALRDARLAAPYAEATA